MVRRSEQDARSPYAVAMTYRARNGAWRFLGIRFVLTTSEDALSWQPAMYVDDYKLIADRALARRAFRGPTMPSPLPLPYPLLNPLPLSWERR